MNSTTAPVAEPEPTIRDVMVGLNTLTEFTQVQFAHLSSEIAHVRAETRDRFDAMDRRFDAMDCRFDAMDRRFDAMDQRVDGIEQDASVTRRHLERIQLTLDEVAPLAREAAMNSRDNRDVLRSLKEDVARIDAKVDLHHFNTQLHLPRQERDGDTQVGPMAA